MNWKPHVIIGCITAAIIFLFIYPAWNNPFQLLLLILFAGLSALVPDIDHRESKGKTILDLGFILIVAGYVYATTCGKGGLCLPSFAVLKSMAITFLAMLGLYFLFFRFMKPHHRGITHTLLATVVFGALVYLLIDSLFAFAAIIGYASHLIADKKIKVI